MSDQVDAVHVEPIDGHGRGGHLVARQPGDQRHPFEEGDPVRRRVYVEDLVLAGGGCLAQLLARPSPARPALGAGVLARRVDDQLHVRRVGPCLRRVEGQSLVGRVDGVDHGGRGASGRRVGRFERRGLIRLQVIGERVDSGLVALDVVHGGTHLGHDAAARRQDPDRDQHADEDPDPAALVCHALPPGC